MNKLFAIILVSVTLFPSCTDILEESPTTFYSEEEIYASPEGVETAITGLYYSLGEFKAYGSGIPNLLLPHSGLFYSSQQANVDMTSLNGTPSNQNVQDAWQAYYSTINIANVAIKNLEAKPENFKNKASSLGHAYFVRGKVYLDLVRAFGGVPLRTTPANIDQLHIPRASVKEVIDLIANDLTKAKQLMPETQSLGRPAKYAAQVYLAKLYMFLAQNDASNWAQARAELQEVIDANKYALLPIYADLFKPGNENTKESIFEIQYGHTGGARTSDIVRLFTPSNSIYVPSNVVTFGRLRPNKEVYDDHKSRYNDDPRITATYVADEYLKNDGTKQRIYPKQKTGNNAYAVIAKWFDPSFNGATSDRNYILLRYADVLLMMAEAVNEMDGPDAAYTYVNQVLSRARDKNGDGIANDATTPANWTGMTKDEFRNRIMWERRYELISEGEDWFDTRRRGYEFFLNTVVKPHNSNPTFDTTKDFKYPESTKNMLLPIPLTEISGNQAIGPEDQNPGY